MVWLFSPPGVWDFWLKLGVFGQGMFEAAETGLGGRSPKPNLTRAGGQAPLQPISGPILPGSRKEKDSHKMSAQNKVPKRPPW